MCVGGGGVCLKSSRPRYNALIVVIISSSAGDLKLNTHTHACVFVFIKLCGVVCFGDGLFQQCVFNNLCSVAYLVRRRGFSKRCVRLCFVQIVAIQASWVELFQSVRFVCLRQVVPNSSHTCSDRPLWRARQPMLTSESVLFKNVAFRTWRHLGFRSSAVQHFHRLCKMAS